MSISSVTSASITVLQSSSPLKAQVPAQNQQPEPKATASDGDSAAVEAAESRTTKLAERNHTRVDKLV